MQFACLLAVALALASSLFFIHTANRYMPPNKSDLLARWIGTRAALAGQDPYSPEVLHEIQTAFYGHVLRPEEHVPPQSFLYPAPLVLLLAPLAPLSWDTARIVYTLVIAPLLAWALWFSLGTFGIALSRWKRAALVAFGVACFPAMWALRLQQPTLMVAVLILFAWGLLARGRQVLPGILLALTIIKPQVALPLLFWLFLWTLVRRRWRLLVSFTTALAVLLAATEWVLPGWFFHWKASLHNYTGLTGTAPPLEHLLGHWAGLVATAAVALTCAAVLVRLRGCAPESPEFGLAISLTLVVAVCLIPAVPPIIYNNLLLLPACFTLILRPPSHPMASLARSAAIVQISWDFFAVMLASGAAAIGKLTPFLAELVFHDQMLPALAALALALGYLLPRTIATHKPEPALEYAP